MVLDLPAQAAATVSGRPEHGEAGAFMFELHRPSRVPVCSTRRASPGASLGQRAGGVCPEGRSASARPEHLAIPPQRLIVGRCGRGGSLAACVAATRRRTLNY